MPPPEKKRPIADFFTSYKKAPTFPANSSIPQKRRSPTPEDGAERSILRETQPTVPKTPSKHGVHKYAATPQRPSHSPLTPRSGALPFRSPRPPSSLQTTPSSVRKTLRRYEEQIQQELKAQRSSPKRQVTLTFEDALRPTQSVLKDGKVVAVRDSDEDDSDSLASLDELFGLKKDGDDTELSSPLEMDEDTKAHERVRTLSLFTQKKPLPRPGFERLRSLREQEKAHKFDISKLLNDHFDTLEDEESAQQGRIRYESSKAKLEHEKNAELHKDLLGSLITNAGGDEDDMARVLGAVSRTEALSTEKTFSFFGPSGLTDWDEREHPVNDFPGHAIPFNLWNAADDDARSRSFLSGYMGELAARRKLSDSALTWTFEAAISERDDYLRSAYVECLKHGSPFWTRNDLSAEEVQRCFQTLGVNGENGENVNSGLSIQSRHQPVKRSDAAPNLKYLMTCLDIFQTLCQHMDFLALGKLASILCRLAIDADLMSYGSVCSEVGKLLSALLDLPEKEARTYVADHVLEDMGKSLHDPVLQAGLLAHLAPTSGTAAQLRLRLAHAFLLGHDNVPAASQDAFSVSLARLSEHVSTSTDFDTLHPTKVDYVALRARAHILDAAMLDGNLPLRFTTTPEKQSFNKSVDALAEAIKKTFVRISDAGASHMSRTEAKDVLHALYYRLLFAVRTEPQPKKNIFDSDSGRMREGDEYRDEGRRQDFMKGFLAKAKKIKREETPPAPSQPSERSDSELMIRRQLGLHQ